MTPHHLWDRWLDGNTDGPESLPEQSEEVDDLKASAGQIDTSFNLFAERARVRPRIISPVTGEAIPLDDQIGQVLEEGRYDYVAFTGGPGSGNDGLHHLAAVLPPWALAKVRLIDDSGQKVDLIMPGDNDNRLVISFDNLVENMPRQVVYSLAPWGQDDTIEYLLSTHFDCFRSVMARLKTTDDRGFLRGIPELWTLVLDRMAHDESLDSWLASGADLNAANLDLGRRRREPTFIRPISEVLVSLEPLCGEPTSSRPTSRGLISQRQILKRLAFVD